MSYATTIPSFKILTQTEAWLKKTTTQIQTAVCAIQDFDEALHGHGSSKFQVASDRLSGSLEVAGVKFDFKVTIFLTASAAKTTGAQAFSFAFSHDGNLFFSIWTNNEGHSNFTTTSSNPSVKALASREHSFVFEPKNTAFIDFFSTFVSTALSSFDALPSSK